MPVRVSVQVEGLTELQRKLRVEPLLAQPLRIALNATQRDVAQSVEAISPRHSGRMASSIRTRMDARPIPRWARVSVTARRRSRKYPSGYRYPRWLQYSSKSPHRGWFSRALTPARATLQRHVEAAKRMIESNWSR